MCDSTTRSVYAEVLGVGQSKMVMCDELHLLWEVSDLLDAGRDLDAVEMFLRETKVS